MGDGSASGNVQYVTGQTGTFVEGMSYNYLYNQGPDSYVDYIGPNGGTIFFRCQSSLGRGVLYSGPGGNTYRAMHSPHIFGALRDGSDSKQDLMTIYMDYLLTPVNVAESEAHIINDLALFPNPARGRAHLSFTLPIAAHVTVNIYNTAGQLVRQLTNREMPTGGHNLIWDGTDEIGKDVSSGSYIFRIETDNTEMNKVVVLIK